MQNTFSPMPLLRWLFPVIFGIVMQYYFPMKVLPPVCIVSTFALLFLVLFFIIKRRSKIWSMAFFLLLFAIGYAVTGIQLNKVENTLQNQEKYPFIAVVDEIPTVKELKTVVVARVIAIKSEGKWLPMKKKAIVSFIGIRDSLLRPGAHLLVKRGLSLPPATVFPMQFDYGRYCKNNGITYLAKVRNGEYYKLNIVDKSMKYQILSLRDFLLKRIGYYFGKNDEESLFASLTLGYTETLTPELKSSYSKAGVMHVLSVSGLHVGIVYMYLTYLFWFLKRNRKTIVIHSILVFVGLWLYAFISGMSSPAIRSTIMFSMFTLAGIIGRKGQSFNILAASALAILLISPLQLFNVGFQLSYAAMAGIFLFYEPINSVMPAQNKVVKFVSALVAVSLAAQLATMPLTLYYFHSFPTYFLIANLLIVPFASILLYASSSFMLFIPFHCIVTTYFAWIMLKLYHFFNYVVGFFGDLPFAAITGFSFTIVDTVLLTVIIAITYLMLHKRESRLVFPALLFAFLFLLGYNTMKILYNKEIMVVSSKVSSKNQVVTIKQEGQLYHITYSNDCSMGWATQSFKAFYGIKDEKYIRLSDLKANSDTLINELIVSRGNKRNFFIRNKEILLFIIVDKKGAIVKTEFWQMKNKTLFKQNLIGEAQRPLNNKEFY